MSEILGGLQALQAEIAETLAGVEDLVEPLRRLWSEALDSLSPDDARSREDVERLRVMIDEYARDGYSYQFGDVDRRADRLEFVLQISGIGLLSLDDLYMEYQLSGR